MKSRCRRSLLRTLCSSLLALFCVAAISAGAANAAMVGGQADAWPYSTLQLGVLSTPSTLAAQLTQAPNMGYAYAYLSGGVNTGNGWANWDTGGGSYVGQFITEAESANVVPVFSYYQLRQSDPGAGQGQDSTADLENLTNSTTMLAWYQDLKLFFQQAATATGPVILQVEPDLWGYIETASKGNANKLKVSVASSGMPDLQGMPNTAAGLAQAILVLRNNYAPQVIVGYHDSSWGTGKNIQSSHPSTAEVTQMAAQSVAFYHSLNAHFNAVFTEMANADAGYAQIDEGQGTTQWWNTTDYNHLGQYLRLVHRALGLPLVLWQIPVGLTSMNNTYQNFADNKLQTLLDKTKASRARLHSYAADGVAAVLFGPSQSSDTQISATTMSLIQQYYTLGTFQVG